MPLPTELSIVPLDFDTIRADIKRFLQNQTAFRDYNFEGSALAVLIDVLAYDAYYHGWYTNFAVNEVFLPTAQVRNSVVAAARQLGYTPRSVSSSVAYVDVAVGGVHPSEGYLVLPRFTTFTTQIAGNTYSFYTINDYSLEPVGQSQVTFAGVELYEGTKARQSFLVDAQRIGERGVSLTLPDANIDTRTLTITVKPDANGSAAYEYERATSAVTVNSSSNVYFLFETNDGSYELRFGDNTLGRALAVGQQVIVDYLVSRGAQGNGADTFSYGGGLIGSLSQTTNVTATLSNANIPSFGGATRESIESIKSNAPEIYRTQGRIVTASDARTVLLTEYNGIESVSVWGGEDNDPPTYGKMFVALKPVNADRFGAAQKDAIYRTLLRPKSLPTVAYEFVDPDFVYVVVNSEVRYSSAFTTLSAVELGAKVSEAVYDYGQMQLGQFGATFRYSQLSKAIDDCDSSIRSNITTVLLEKRFYTNSIAGSYTLNFGNPIHAGSGNGDVVTISSRVGTQRFSFTDEGGILRTDCYLQNEGSYLHVYREVTETDAINRQTTKQLVTKARVGTVDFESGRIVLSNFRPKNITTDVTGELKLRVVPRESDLDSLRAQIILIPRNNITIRAVEDAARNVTSRPLLVTPTTF